MVTAITDYDSTYLEVTNDGVAMLIKKSYVEVRLNAGDPNVVDFSFHWYERNSGKRLFLLEFARFTPTTYASAAALLAAIQAMLISGFTPASATLSLTPIGIMAEWGSSVIPAGFLLCDGTAISRATYSSLFTVIGTTFGAGDGSTTFNLPDRKGRFGLGKSTAGTGSTLGGSGGNIDHTHTIAHTHQIDPPNTTSTAPSVTTTSLLAAGVDIRPTNTHTHDVNIAAFTSGAESTANSGTANAPFLSINIIIRYTNSVADFDEAVQDAVGNTFQDTTTIDFTYDDTVPSIKAVVVNDSIDNTKLANMANATFKVRVTAGTGDPEDGTAAQVRTILGIQFSHTFATGTFTQLTWTDMPLALSFWNGGTTGTGRYFSLSKLDLTNYAQVKMILVKGSVAGVAGANIKLRYATTDDNTAANYLTIGSSELQTTFGTGVNQIYDTGWIDLVALAKADVYCVILGDTGNGIADPTFHKVYALFR